MSRLARGMLALALVVSLNGPSVFAQRQAENEWRIDAKEHGWRLDYKQARQEAKRSGKPMMVVIRCIP